jgi:hypothetical protein
MSLVAILLFLILLCLLPRTFWKGLGWLITAGFIFYLVQEHPGLDPATWPWADILLAVAVAVGLLALVWLAVFKFDGTGRLKRRAIPRTAPGRIPGNSSTEKNHEA